MCPFFSCPAAPHASFIQASDPAVAAAQSRAPYGCFVDFVLSYTTLCATREHTAEPITRSVVITPMCL